VNKVLDGARPPRPWKTHSGSSLTILDSFWSLVERCWDANIAKRPTGDEIVDAISTILSGSVPFIPFSLAASVDHEVANDLHLAAAVAHTARNELREYPLLHPTHSSKMILLADALIEQY
jgi:hypothetical protein